MTYVRELGSYKASLHTLLPLMPPIVALVPLPDFPELPARAMNATTTPYRRHHGIPTGHARL